MLNGGDGNDVLAGGAGGVDIMNGGVGTDTLDYTASSKAVDVRLFSGAASGGAANNDVFTSIENLIGSTKTDTLVGDAGVNSIWGGLGNETILGREGADVLLGGLGDDVLVGGTGNDTLGGGSGNDTADYSASDAGVTVNLHLGAGVGSHAQGDGLFSIENVIGSSFDDVIIGKSNSWDNVLDGGAGNDTLTGGLGNDTFVFRSGQGSDTITDLVAGGVDDAVLLSGFGASFDTFAEILAASTQVGADVVISLGGQTLTLENVQLGNLTSNDFLFGP